MSGLKGGALLLVLGIPLAGYCALQGKAVARTEVVASEPPDRGPTKEQLDAGRAKSAALLADVRKAAEVAQQFGTSAPGGATAPAAAAVAKAAAARSADLTDFDLFLADTERPNFTGRLKGQYEKWAAERRELRRDERAITDWLARAPEIASAADAAKAAKEAEALIDQYATRSRFSDTAKAAVWRVLARLVVADGLGALADAQYRAAVRQKLPLKPNDPSAATLRALKRAIDDLNAAAKSAEGNGRLDAALRAAVTAKGAAADECAAREELLSLLAKDDLFSDPEGAAPWLKQVAAKYARTKGEADRALIRQKVQEFCEAFVPREARLDDRVLFDGKEVERKDVVVRYQLGAGGKVMRKPLSGELDGANEFNLAAMHPGQGTWAEYMGSQAEPPSLKPTELSKAAALYNGERKKLSDGTRGAKWTAKSVGQLKKACEAQKERVEELEVPGGGSRGKPLKIWTRLTGVAEGLAAHPELVGAGQ
jgi:hypothetical protein